MEAVRGEACHHGRTLTARKARRTGTLTRGLLGEKLSSGHRNSGDHPEAEGWCYQTAPSA